MVGGGGSMLGMLWIQQAPLKNNLLELLQWG